MTVGFHYFNHTFSPLFYKLLMSTYTNYCWKCSNKSMSLATYIIYLMFLSFEEKEKKIVLNWFEKCFVREKAGIKRTKISQSKFTQIILLHPVSAARCILSGGPARWLLPFFLPSRWIFSVFQLNRWIFWIFYLFGGFEDSHRTADTRCDIVETRLKNTQLATF